MWGEGPPVNLPQYSVDVSNITWSVVTNSTPKHLTPNLQRTDLVDRLTPRRGEIQLNVHAPFHPLAHGHLTPILWDSKRHVALNQPDEGVLLAVRLPLAVEQLGLFLIKVQLLTLVI